MRNVGVIERSKNLGLALESQHAAGITREQVRQDLQCDVAFELGIPRPVYLAHPSRANRRKNLVGSELGSRRHFFSPAVQFSATVIGSGEGSPVSVFTRNFCPSRLAT